MLPVNLPYATSVLPEYGVQVSSRVSMAKDSRRVVQVVSAYTNTLASAQLSVKNGVKTKQKLPKLILVGF